MPKQTDSRLSKREFLKLSAGGACAMCMAGVAAPANRAVAQATQPGPMAVAEPGLIRHARSPWFEAAGNDSIRCTLCPRGCVIPAGRRGPCRVRGNWDGEGYTLV